MVCRYPTGTHRSSTIRVLEGGAAATLMKRVSEHGPHTAVLADSAVLAAHPSIAQTLRELPAAVQLIIEGGESCKSFATLQHVLETLTASGMGRDAHLVIVGGGSLGDLGGLAAALYLRGIECTQVPTTLLAMVDSSVGGKTAIDVTAGKNLVGAFWPATEVILDPTLLASLPETEFLSGLGEVVKAAIGFDPELFDFMATRHDAIVGHDLEAVTEMIRRAVAAKIHVVEIDFREAGPRRLLNLGHTLGHALEAAAGMTLVHGVAVARGIHFALDVAQARGVLDASDASEAADLLRLFGFERNPIPSADVLMPFIRRDKKADIDGVWMALPTGRGKSVIEHVPFAVIEDLVR